MNLVKELVDTTLARASQFVSYEEDLLRHLVVAYFAQGHVLLEGLPGTGKTTVAKLLAALLARTFKRIQFTSDLLPADLLGAHVYQPKTGELEFIRGPLFAEVVFADEVNRAPPRTQSALLESMEERQITVEGKTFPLSPDFFVVATQNPHELEGTFPLPEAQVDRFLMKIKLSYGAAERERWVVAAVLEGKLPLRLKDLSTVDFSMTDVQAEIAQVRVDASLVDYVVRLVRATREHVLVQQGSSVRGAIGLIRSARVWAASLGRDFVVPDDVKSVAPSILGHRVQLTPEAQLSQSDSSQVVADLLRTVPFPT